VPRHRAEGRRNHLAYLSWLLNPTAIENWPKTAAAPDPTFEDAATWVDVFNLMMEERNFYDPKPHKGIVDLGVPKGWLVANDDNAILRQFGMLA
jgi:hypothetical protein